jgi:hypothetical protein
VPQPDHPLPHPKRLEPEARAAAALVALARLMGRAAAQEHHAASEHVRARQDDNHEDHQRRSHR